MPDYLGMLGSRGVFRRPGSLGMPNIGNVDGFDEAMSAAEEMKHNDMNRQREMMRFQEAMRVREEQRAMMNEALHRNERSVFGPVNKQRIAQQAPLTSMQQRLRQDEVAETGNKFKMGQIQAEESGKLATALAAGKQRSDADMAKTQAELAHAATQGSASRASAEKIAADNLAAQQAEHKTQRDFTSKENEKARNDKGWEVVNRTDPNDPTKQITVRMNKSTGEVQPLTQDGQNIPGVSKPGSKLIGGVPDKELSGIREQTQDVINEIDEMLDNEGKLKSHAAAAVGKSRMFGAIADKVGMGSLTPETTKGTTAINTFKSKLIIDLIGRMKAQSKTGATGFGQMNMKELGVLENAVGKLNPNMADDDFAAEMNKIREKLRKIMAAGSDEVAETDKRKRAAEIMRRHGF